jgi:hypothetical protein
MSTARLALAGWPSRWRGVAERVEPCKDVYAGTQLAGCGRHRRDNSLIARTLERIQARPVRRQVGRLEHRYCNVPPTRIQNQPRVAVVGSPSAVHKVARDMTGQPSAFEALQLLMVRASRAQSPVGRKSVLRHNVARIKHPNNLASSPAMRGRVHSSAWPAHPNYHCPRDALNPTCQGSAASWNALSPNPCSCAGRATRCEHGATFSVVAGGACRGRGGCGRGVNLAPRGTRPHAPYSASPQVSRLCLTSCMNWAA